MFQLAFHTNGILSLHNILAKTVPQGPSHGFLVRLQIP
jgi:hypothetical protein